VFDTLFAEGQRRYVESLSAYARQFLGKMNKPDVDYIHGISPSIAIEQKVNTRNPRSTVATSTEIYDYLKLLFARVGSTYSPISGRQVKRHAVEDGVDYILNLNESTKVLILVEIKEGENGLKKTLETYLQNGFSRVMLNDEMLDLEDAISNILPAKKTKNSDIYYLVIDRFSVLKNDDEFSGRIADSIQTAFYEGHGECIIAYYNEQNEKISEILNNRFELDGMVFEEPSVNFFSFNNPYGACKTCEGFGSVVGIDEDLVIPDKSRSIFDDAIVPWKGDKMSDWKTIFLKVSAKSKFPIHKPYYELTQSQKNYLWDGDETWVGLHGFFGELEKQTYKIQYRVMLARYRGKTSCPDCKGTRLRKDASFVRITEINENIKSWKDYMSLSNILLMSIDDAVTYFNSLKISEQHQIIAKRMLTEITNRLGFLQNG
jgi:excinuclease ABC subunit A